MPLLTKSTLNDRQSSTIEMLMYIKKVKRKKRQNLQCFLYIISFKSCIMSRISKAEQPLVK